MNVSALEVASITSGVDIDEEGHPLTLQEQAYRIISSDIIRCRYKPGEKLTINTLVNKLELGRTPIREALVRLQEAGLVDVVPQVSTTVSKISVRDADSARFVRETIGRKIAIECCSKWQGQDLNAPRKANAMMHQAMREGDSETYFDNDNKFHYQLYHIAGRDRVYSWVAEVNLPVSRLRWLRLMTDTLDWQSLTDQHDQILAAIEARDASETDYLMSEHLHRLLNEKERVIQQFPEYFVMDE